MGMMTGCRWRRGVAAFVLSLPMPALAGCDERSAIAADPQPSPASDVDRHGRQACAEFRSGWQRATDTPARLQLADTVERLARRSDSAAINESAAAMGRSADGDDRAWRAAATGLLRTCGRAGSSTAPPPALPVTG